MLSERFTPKNISKGIGLLKKRISELEALNTNALTGVSDPKIVGMRASIKTTLLQIFGDGTSEFQTYASAATLQTVQRIGILGERDDFRAIAEASRVKSIALLEAAITNLEERLDAVGTPEEESVSKEWSNKVFIVHGHDDGAKHEVARFLSQLGLEPVILHEQASRGQTIIEKIHHYGDCGFAVVLLTGDDVGGKSDIDLKPRARQNVILELGYFIGRLGRERVSALKKGDVETPSDFDGVVYTAMDAGEGWKASLARELKAAGYKIDWNKVMA